eukprot:4706656-Prymnesium_polylepis.2
MHRAAVKIQTRVRVYVARHTLHQQKTIVIETRIHNQCELPPPPHVPREPAGWRARLERRAAAARCAVCCRPRARCRCASRARDPADMAGLHGSPRGWAHDHAIARHPREQCGTLHPATCAGAAAEAPAATSDAAR